MEHSTQLGSRSSLCGGKVVLDPDSQSTSDPDPKSRVESPYIAWPGVYRLCVSLNTSMLATLHHAYMPDALNFFGVHRERIVQVRGDVQKK